MYYVGVLNDVVYRGPDKLGTVESPAFSREEMESPENHKRTREMVGTVILRNISV